MFDVPPDELPEMALTRDERAASSILGLDKRPMLVRSRPTARPAWSHLERRVARVWSREGGHDRGNLEGLVGAKLNDVTVVEPSSEELHAWLASELPRSEAHLRTMLDDYWVGEWRRDHTGRGVHPDDHLWRAAWAVQSMRDALAELTP